MKFMCAIVLTLLFLFANGSENSKIYSKYNTGILKQRLAKIRSGEFKGTEIWSGFIWVQEQEAKNEQVWSHRYFVLHGNGKFEYYLTPNKHDKKGEGSISNLLTGKGYTIQGDAKSKQITFYTQVKNWCFEFESAEDQEYWIKISKENSHIQEMIQNQLKSKRHSSKFQNMVKQAQEMEEGIWKGCIYIEEESVAERSWFHRYVVLHGDGNFEYYKNPKKISKIGDGGISNSSGKCYTQEGEGKNILVTFHGLDKNWRFQFEHDDDRKFWTMFCDTKFSDEKKGQEEEHDKFRYEIKIILPSSEIERDEKEIQAHEKRGEFNLKNTTIIEYEKNGTAQTNLHQTHTEVVTISPPSSEIERIQTKMQDFLKQTTTIQPKKEWCCCCKTKQYETIKQKN